jgi:SAM-dependent methyltransferase
MRNGRAGVQKSCRGEMSDKCSVCGGTAFQRGPVLWPRLIDEWQLSPFETDYIDRQQGECCTACGASLRLIALATALLSVFHAGGTLSDFVSSAAASVPVLAVNPSGALHPILSRMPDYVLASYPEIDIHALPYADGSFDVVVHSDTLEHVRDPLHALGECHRVLRPGGALCFTVPVISGRLSRDREGLPKSHHGNPAETGDDYVVHTEFGADMWTYPMRAGFREVRLFSLDFPAALAMAAYK